MAHADGVSPQMIIDVCICAFRRHGVEATLRSLAAQRLPPGVGLRVIVADNDDEPLARGRLTTAAARLGLDMTYVHAPARNISVARNACLDQVRSAWFAFIDDDETAAPGWLAALLAKTEDADAVFGPVRGLYDDQAPAWLRRGVFHDTTVVFSGGRIRTGYSGNVLIRREAVERLGLRFDPQRGRTGGEDTVFFGRLHDGGGRLVFAPEAVAVEPVAASRTTLRWLARRSFRSGRSFAELWLNRHGRWSLPLRSARGAATLAVCAAGAATTFWSAERWRRWLLRGMLHAGAVSFWLGFRE